MKRRKFLKYGVGSLLTAPLILKAYPGVYTDNYASPIVSVFDELATNLSFTNGKVLNYDGVIVDKIVSHDIINSRVAKMVDAAIMKITSASSVGKAWESLFPIGHPNASTKLASNSIFPTVIGGGTKRMIGLRFIVHLARNLLLQMQLLQVSVK